jgi:hypothetical protein
MPSPQCELELERRCQSLTGAARAPRVTGTVARVRMCAGARPAAGSCPGDSESGPGVSLGPLPSGPRTGDSPESGSSPGPGPGPQAARDCFKLVEAAREDAMMHGHPQWHRDVLRTRARLGPEYPDRRLGKAPPPPPPGRRGGVQGQ